MHVNQTGSKSLKKLDFDLRRYETFVKSDADDPNNKSSGHYIFKTAFPESEPLKHAISSIKTYHGLLKSMFVIKYVEEGVMNNTFVRIMLDSNEH